MSHQHLAKRCLDLVDPDYYEAHGYPHETWRELRREEPIRYVERDVGDSFWAITRLQDITTIGRQPDVFSSASPVVRDGEQVDNGPGNLPDVLIQLDPPIHARYRHLVSKRMTPRKVAEFHNQIDEIAVRILADLEEHEGQGMRFRGDCRGASTDRCDRLPARRARRGLAQALHLDE